MVKRWLLVGMIFLLVPWLVVGCGVAQEQYDAVVSDLGKAQQELQSVKGELESTQAKVSELTSSQEKAKSELKATQAELETTRAKVSELTSNLEKTKSELEVAQGELEATQAEQEAFKSELASECSRFDKIVGLEWFIVGYWSAGARQDEELIEQRTAQMVSYVEPVGDPMLTSLWQQAMDAAAKGQETLFLESFAAMMDRNSKLLSDQAKVIRSMLAE